MYSMNDLNANFTTLKMISSVTKSCVPARGGQLLFYLGYIGMCGPKGYGFSAALAIT